MLPTVNRTVSLLHQVHVFILLNIEEYLLAVLLHDVESISNVFLVPVVPDQHSLCLQLLHHLLEAAWLVLKDLLADLG